jgi:hypothetical protein
MVIWRSLIHYTRRALVCDLIPLPSEISTLGGHFPIGGRFSTEEDVEYIAEDMMEDMGDAGDPY